MTEKSYSCPMCNVPLSISLGNVFNHNKEGYGLTMFCNNRACPVEVFGYTRNQNPDAAYEIIEEKYIPQKTIA